MKIINALFTLVILISFCCKKNSIKYYTVTETPHPITNTDKESLITFFKIIASKDKITIFQTDEYKGDRIANYNTNRPILGKYNIPLLHKMMLLSELKIDHDTTNIGENHKVSFDLRVAEGVTNYKCNVHMLTDPQLSAEIKIKKDSLFLQRLSSFPVIQLIDTSTFIAVPTARVKIKSVNNTMKKYLLELENF